METVKHVRLLSDAVINKIAAGEVVDRPSSVVKELVENALDAGAANITVELSGGGRRAIVVSDDGGGMGRDDALLAIERHATSKIRDVADVERVQTLGFRGEALAAIAAVSHFSLVTRSGADPAGTELVVNGGVLAEVKDAGAPPGTQIGVRHLFYNVPARRKFLRAEETESAHARQVFLTYALAYPETGWRLVSDERETYRFAPHATLETRLREIYGADFLPCLRPVAAEGPGLRVTGFAGLPGAARRDRGDQYFFINRRPISAPVLHHALNEAYRTLLPHDRFPAVFLFIDMDCAEVDVNVHPTKKEVRFRNASAVRDTVLAGLRNALQVNPPSAPAGTPPWATPRPVPPAPDTPALKSFIYPRPAGVLDVPAFPPPAPSSGFPPAGTPAPPPHPAHQAPWSQCRILGQAGGLYVVLETGDGLVLMDPHAAHERVLYERFMAEVTHRKVRSQGLLAPETVPLQPRDAERVRGQLPLLAEMGFGIADFGGDTFIVDALPACLAGAPAATVLAEVAQTFEQSGPRGGEERWREDAIASAACKAAVKAHDRLSNAEIENLIADLARAEMPYTCPHGRPTLIFMGFDELARKFGRIR